MQTQTKYISFATQKGGAGKSTFTAMVASLLHYTMGYSVAVIDCDKPQFSLTKLRERDIKCIASNTHHNASAELLYTKLNQENKKSFPIYSSIISEALVLAARIEEECPTDYILFDMSGSLNISTLKEGGVAVENIENAKNEESDAILRFLISMDYLFIPIVADMFNIQSALEFFVVTQIAKKIYPSRADMQSYFFWTAVDLREKTPLYDVYSEVIEKDYNGKILQSKIPQTVKFRKEINETTDVYRCTLLPPNSGEKFTEAIEKLAQEITKIH